MTMQAQDISNYLRSLDGGWVDWNDSVDTFKAGDPATEVRGIAVGWMSYTWALERAVELGCNLFITHEPTYYSHRDNDETVFQYDKVRAKREFIASNGLVILRCHDLWDKYPGLGIPDSWAAFLGFNNPLVTDGYFRVFDVTGETARSLARRVARKTAALGQESVRLLGPADTPVHRLALGTGAITPFRRMMDSYGCDVAICTEDGFTYWRDGALAIDLGIPAIIVDHAVSEIYGVQKLAEHLAEKFPNIPVHSIAQTCMFQTVHGI